MVRSMVLLLWSIGAVMFSAIPGQGAEESHQGVFYSTPPGWTSGTQDGQFILGPADMTEETAVVVVLYGAEKLGGKSFDGWFHDRLISNLDPHAKVLSDGEIKSTEVGDLQMLTTARAIQDAEGGVRIRMYHAVSDGRQAALAIGVTASEKAINKYAEGIQALFESLRFKCSVNPGASVSPAPASPSTPPASDASNSSDSSSRPITVADLTGHWVHSNMSYADYVKSETRPDVRTLTTGYGKEYTFAADGTYKYFIDSRIVTRSLNVTESDSGTWSFENSKLVLKSKEGGTTMKFYIIEYQKAPDSTAFLTLLNDMYSLTASDIHDYGYHFVRVAPRR